MDEIRKELDLVSDDASVEEETDFAPSKKEMAEVEEAIYGVLEEQGRVVGESKKNVRTRAKETVGPLFPLKNGSCLALIAPQKLWNREAFLKPKSLSCLRLQSIPTMCYMNRLFQG